MKWGTWLPYHNTASVSDIIEEIFLLLQISPVMEAEELTNDILAIKNIVPSKGDIWATFEVIENEELGEWLLC